MTSIGLALSGGGARGIAHLGAIKALEEMDIKPTIMAGTSAGSIAGAFYAYGYRPEETLEIIIKTNLYQYIRPAINIRGLLKLEKVVTIFQQYFEHDSFEALKIPLFVTATDIKQGTTKYFSQGELIMPVLASSCIPVIFDPVNVEGRDYIDGGVLNNLPADPLVGHCDQIIGIHTNPASSDFSNLNMKDLLERTFLLAFNYNSYTRRSLCDFFIEPPDLKYFKVFDFKKAEEIFNVGYRYTKEFMRRQAEFPIR